MNKHTFSLTTRQVMNYLIIAAVLVTALVGTSQVFAQRPDPAAVDSSCEGAGQVNQSNDNGLRHVTYNCGIWVVKYHNGEPYLQWSPRDVSASNGDAFPGSEEYYPNTPGTVLPDYPIADNPAPRNLVTNEPLDVTITDGVISILPGEGNGSVTVSVAAGSETNTEETAKKGFRCKPTGNGYQLNDVSVNADNSGFFVEVDQTTLESWSLLNGQDLNDVQSDFCGSLDPNAPAVVTADPLASDSITDTTVTDPLVVNVNGNTVTSTTDGTVTVTDQSGVVIASGTEGSVIVDDTTIVVPVNGTVTQPEGAGGAGSGGSAEANGHEGEVLACEVNNGGQEVCKWVKP